MVGRCVLALVVRFLGVGVAGLRLVLVGGVCVWVWVAGA